MYRPRIIPTLLLQNGGLVKSIGFKKYRYIGDPINAVRIFNDLYADELVFLDIEATHKQRIISLDFLQNIAKEANMPFSYGGGIKSISDIGKIIASGAEKVVICSYAVTHPKFINEAASTFGSSTIVISIDYKSTFLYGSRVFINSGRTKTKYTPLEFAKIAEENGAGEIILQSIDNDGLMKGYDIDTLAKVAQAIEIPVVALGGAGSIKDLFFAYNTGMASAISAGSLFIYHGQRKAVLINYPSKEEIFEYFKI